MSRFVTPPPRSTPFSWARPHRRSSQRAEGGPLCKNCVLEKGISTQQRLSAARAPLLQGRACGGGAAFRLSPSPSPRPHSRPTTRRPLFYEL